MEQLLFVVGIDIVSNLTSSLSNTFLRALQVNLFILEYV